MTELNKKDIDHIQIEAVKYQRLAEFIAHEIFQTADVKVGYQVIAKFASEDYFIVKGDEIKENAQD